MAESLSTCCPEISITPLCTSISGIKWIRVTIHQIKLVVIGPNIATWKHIQSFVTPRSTQLQEVNPLYVLHESLVRDIPCCRNIWRECPLAARSQTAGTRLYERNIQEVSAIETIVSEERYIVTINSGVGTSLVIVFIIILQLSVYIVLLCKSSIVVDRSIPDATANPVIIVSSRTHIGVRTLYGRHGGISCSHDITIGRNLVIAVTIGFGMVLIYIRPCIITYLSLCTQSFRNRRKVLI